MGILQPISCHVRPALQYPGCDRGDLPVTERIAGEILSLPMCAEQAAEQLVRVAGTIGGSYSGSAQNS
ncbi:hypothetical protein ACFLT5_00260 [Chloroflexota bacterium]